MRPNVLVIYHLRDPRPRVTLLDHLYSLRRYSSARVSYFNVANGRLPGYLANAPWDLIVFHYAFVSDRIVPDHFARLVSRVEALGSSAVPKVVVAQDEHIHGDLLCRFINDFGVSHVFTCAELADQRRIYRTVDFDLVTFETVLTGYLDEGTLRRIGRLARRDRSRQVDVGYRSWYPWPSLGRHAQLKGRIGEVFAEAAPAAGLTADISSGRGAGNETKDTLKGDDWYRFLLDCRFTIGVEGGASVLDWDGSINARTHAYLAAHPDASFEEVEAACFPGQDGNLGLMALSPRHLEACATRTCQVLVEGRYNGVLTPGLHYIPLSADLSNISDVLAQMKSEPERIRMVDAAYRDIVDSGDWTYRGFVAKVLAHASPVGVPTLGSAAVHLTSRLFDDAWRGARAAKGVARQAAVRVLGETRVRDFVCMVKRAVGRGA